MKPLNESQLDALDAFVRHMVSVNDTNGALYDFAERAIRTDGGVYWNCKLRGAKDLYARAVAFYKSRENDLKNRARIVSVTPTPTDLTISANIQLGLMQDYSQSQQRGWSTN
jgi:hypothetical protein